jgi:hypothetical protein
MASGRRGVRERGKSDRIAALAVPVPPNLSARPSAEGCKLRLLVDYRDELGAPLK